MKALATLLFLSFALLSFYSAGTSAQVTDNSTSNGNETTTCSWAGVQVAVLLDNNYVVVFSAANENGTRSAQVLKLSGARGQRLRSLETNPFDGSLVAISDKDRVFSVDLEQATVTPLSDLTNEDNSTSVKLHRKFAVDFDPATGLLRVIDRKERNYQLDVLTGILINETDIHIPSNATEPPPTNGTDGPVSGNGTDTSGSVPIDIVEDDLELELVKIRITAIAFSNNVAGSNESALYAIEGRSKQLVVISPPENGTIEPIGPLTGLDKRNARRGRMGFDIFTDSETGCELAILGSGREFYTLDLETGNATQIWERTSRFLTRTLNSFKIKDLTLFASATPGNGTDVPPPDDDPDDDLPDDDLPPPPDDDPTDDDPTDDFPQDGGSV
jgi:hypothetical protein